jgi:hypothetical protein
MTEVRPSVTTPDHEAKFRHHLRQIRTSRVLCMRVSRGNVIGTASRPTPRQSHGSKPEHANSDSTRRERWPPISAWASLTTSRRTTEPYSTASAERRAIRLDVTPTQKIATVIALPREVADPVAPSVIATSCASSFPAASRNTPQGEADSDKHSQVATLRQLPSRCSQPSAPTPLACALPRRKPRRAPSGLPHQARSSTVGRSPDRKRDARGSHRARSEPCQLRRVRP